MPELPEVETIKRDLISKVLGKKAVKMQVKLPRILLGKPPRGFSRLFKNQVLQQVHRRGKYLVFEWEKEAFIVHLGMTGQLMAWDIKNAGKVQKVRSKENTLRTVTGMELAKVPLKDKHTHMILEWEGGGGLFFRDVRTFGKIIYVPNKDWKGHARIAKLGPEPIGLHVSRFLKERFPIQNKCTIKAHLLNQAFLAGLGNIYCDESLFLSKIHPETPAFELSQEQWTILVKNAQKVLKKGIRNAGTTFSDYRTPSGSKGSNQERLLVYGRGGESCKKCKEILVKTVVAQRGTVFCPKCQRYKIP